MTVIHSFGKKGIVHDDGMGFRMFEKWVSREKHFMRKNKSWAIDCKICDKLREMGVSTIYLHVKGEPDIWTTMVLFDKHSTIERYGDFDEQEFLNEEYWMQVGD